MSDVTTVNIIVNTAPVAGNDSYSVAEDGTLTRDAAAGIFDNDSDTNGDEFTATVTQEPQHGDLSLNSENGSFTYTPDPDYNGPDSFVYTLSDGVATSRRRFQLPSTR
jgi:hypothetical protein